MGKTNYGTIGISPKVKAPAIVLGVVGIALIVAGALIGEDALVAAGGGMLASSPLGGYVGYRSEPGEVKIDVGVPSDDRLEIPPEVRNQ